MEGVVGKQLFQLLRSIVNMDTVVGMVQSMILGLLILATHIYVRIKDRIPTKDIWGSLVSGCIGAAFGVLSAFLGIGGEPMNLAMFDYFFLMDTKQASINSILILSLF